MEEEIKKEENQTSEEMDQDNNDLIEALNKANERLSIIRQAIAQQESQMRVGGVENEE